MFPQQLCWVVSKPSRTNKIIAKQTGFDALSTFFNKRKLCLLNAKTLHKYMRRTDGGHNKIGWGRRKLWWTTSFHKTCINTYVAHELRSWTIMPLEGCALGGWALTAEIRCWVYKTTKWWEGARQHCLVAPNPGWREKEKEKPARGLCAHT